MIKPFSIPDHMPVLSPGNHRKDGTNGACIMEFVSVLAGEKWSDHPATVHSGLGFVARNVNDGISDQVFLQGLALLAPRFIGTAKYDGDRGPFMTESMMFHISTDSLDRKLGAWAVNRVIGYLPETVRVKVQPAFTQIAADGEFDPDATEVLRRTLADLGTSESNAANARVTVHGFLRSILQSNRAGVYQAVTHAFFTIAHAEGKGEVAPMMAEWLDHFDALTGHSLTDTQPEPTGDDNKGEDETPVIQYGGWTTPMSFDSGDTFTWVNALQASTQLISLVTK